MASDPKSTPELGLKCQIRLTRFVWDRGVQRDILTFAPGFNLIGDRTQPERTDIARLIRYGMGGSHSRIEDGVMQATVAVELEFTVNQTIVRTRRSFEHPDGRFQFAVGDRVENLSPRDAAERLMELGNVPKVHYQRGEAKVLLSFNDLARAFVVDRDFSYTEMLSQMAPEPRRETMKLMLGFTTQDIADTEEKIRQVAAQVQKLTDEIRGIERFLTEFKVGSLVEIESERRQISDELQQILTEDDRLRDRIARAAQVESAVDAKGTNEYSVSRDDLVSSRERLDALESERAVVRRQLREKEELKLVLISEVDLIERQLASGFVLSSFSFTQCPRCMRPIDDEMKRRELHGDCSLCGRPLGDYSEEQDESHTKASTDTRKAVEESDQLIQYLNRRLRDLDSEASDLNSRIDSLQSQLVRQTAKYVSPLVEEFSLVNERRGLVMQRKSANETDLRQRLYANRLQDEALPLLRKTAEGLQDNLRELQEKRGQQKDRVAKFLDHFNRFMRTTAGTSFQSSQWDATEYLPMVNRQDHKRALSGPDLALAVLGFHYALLALRSGTNAFDTAHPGLLIIDEPNQQVMAEIQYRSVMAMFIELSQHNPEDAQIIVAVTDFEGYEEYLRPIVSETREPPR